MSERLYQLWHEIVGGKQCEATITTEDDRWGSFNDRCDRPKNHRGEHRARRTACTPQGWLAWPKTKGQEKGLTDGSI